MPILKQCTMDFFERERDRISTVIVPCGSLEEHGPHLPLGTDTLHAQALADAVAQRHPVWSAPPLWYGVCRSSSAHPGTVGIRSATLRALVLDVVEGFVRQGMRQVVLLSGHAGGTHMATLLDAGEELLERCPDLRMAVLSVLDLGRAAWSTIQETPGDSHAGEVETSLMLHLHPKWVQGTAEEAYPTFPAHILVRNKRAYWRSGVWGNPPAASPDKGRRLLEASVAALIELIEKLKAWEEPNHP
ncbi:creatinine amidohydrolase [Desulfacinum hydrothermale DSM 13146]|uniref:Creatinine amidohydrolase n=1 Tax=Desulfacinum hydrothermale DSM 13146 TaxID=1121390 RepID=A0A1W1XL89_9BACT|nr:creatininase family protein [Desulfacinum hydrothermale]SMC24622.1 creatinine amidohydrolase [Desulfacinum hydrothermale DSM 13146]